MTVILLLVLSSAYSFGKRGAQAGLIVNNALELKRGLDFFYQDQDRFPTPLEFQNTNIMSRYFSNFPLSEFPVKGCSELFVYKRTSPTSFQLHFCLPAQSGGYKKGWNQIEQDKS